MKGITIGSPTSGGDLTVDFRTLLILLGQEALNSKWRVHMHDYLGVESSVFEGCHEDVGGLELITAAFQVSQLIEGTLVAYDDRGVWLRVELVDGSLMDVFASDPKRLELLSEHFHDVEEYPSGESVVG